MMRYEWTPASEPPDTRRDVVVWCEDEALYIGEYVLDPTSLYGFWSMYGQDVFQVTYWCDLPAPPNSSATLTGSGEP